MDSRSDSARVGLCLIVAYDGTDLHGSQLQPHARTVQGELERAIACIAGHPARARFSGRTDAGVHALRQVVAFDSARVIAPRSYMRALNTKLPPDVRVQHAVSCPAGYDPRFEAVAKTYRYVVQRGEVTNPLLRHRAYQLGRDMPLDIARMREAAAQLVGTHDFRAFRAADDTRENTMRTLYSLDIHDPFADDPTLLAMEVRGTAFMKNMVRILAGTLLDVARGRILLAHVPTLLGPTAQRPQAGHTAPAHGLTLVSVELGRKSPCPFTQPSTVES